jgi:hypothetical protein
MEWDGSRIDGAGDEQISARLAAKAIGICCLVLRQQSIRHSPSSIDRVGYRSLMPSPDGDVSLYYQHIKHGFNEEDRAGQEAFPFYGLGYDN